MREIATQFPFKFMKDKRLVLILSLWNCNRSTLICRRSLICCWLKRSWSSSHLRIGLVMNLGMVIYCFVAQLLDPTIILLTVFVLYNNIHLMIGVVRLGMVTLMYDGIQDWSSFKVL